MNIKSILVAYEQSPSADKALLEAAYLADKFKASISVIHALDADISQVFSVPLAKEWKGKVHAKVKGTLEQFYATHKAMVKIKDVFVEIGVPHKTIVKKAMDVAADLIIVGSNSRSVLGYVMLGSVADKVISHSPMPVLVSRADRAHAKNKILVPVDESLEAERAIVAAKEMAALYHAQVTLLHAIDVKFYDYVDDGTIMQSIIQKACVRLKALCQKYDLGENFLVLTGNVSHVIIDCIKEDTQMGLVVMTTHGHTGFKHFMLGSVAQAVARYAPCDLLVIPSHKQKAGIEAIKNELTQPQVMAGNVIL